MQAQSLISGWEEAEVCDMGKLYKNYSDVVILNWVASSQLFIL